MLAVGLLALVLPMTAPPSQAAPAAPDHDRAGPTARLPERVVTSEHPVTSRAAGFGIDTSDRSAVAKAFRTRLRPNLSVSSGWTGSLRRCRAGTTSVRAQRATMESLNFARAMNGLSRVSWSAKLSARAQHTALIMAANRNLSHYPPRRWKCWSKVGSDAAARSNLSIDFPRLTAGGAVMQYLDDWGSRNTVVGHRRWILFPFAEVFGNAMTKTTNAMFVVGPVDTSNPNPAWVRWPSAGWFPSQAEPLGRWSLSSGDPHADFRSAKIAVRRNGRPVRIKKYAVHDGYAMPTLVWEVYGLEKTGKYVVTVTGIKGAAAPAVRYAVKLFMP
ncbi:MAG: CAP domain-containing protein [Nocardioides sp.]|nr:CAP domain-containing protein [Nocardioides sp.]